MYGLTMLLCIGCAFGCIVAIQAGNPWLAVLSAVGALFFFVFDGASEDD